MTVRSRASNSRRQRPPFYSTGRAASASPAPPPQNQRQGNHSQRLFAPGNQIHRRIRTAAERQDPAEPDRLSHLARFTAAFAAEHLDPRDVRRHVVARAKFNYDTESWASAGYDLPALGDDYVLLAPRSLLTKDETWINRQDLIVQLPDVIASVSNEAQRAAMNNYLLRLLPTESEPTRAERNEAAEATVRAYPQLIEHFIRMKEDRGSEAVSVSALRVAEAEMQFIRNVRELIAKLDEATAFYETPGRTADEARGRVAFLKDIIENKGGWRLFYRKGVPVPREQDLQIVFRFTWCGTPSDVSREVDDGRGPADFKISRGLDKTIVEFKLASNKRLKQNLAHQAELYQAASDAPTGVKVIMYFSQTELDRVLCILKELDLEVGDDIVLIDASPKTSASRVA